MIRALRGLLGLTGYYHKLVKDYGIITAPLTKLLHKNFFYWDVAAAQTFVTLIMAMTSTSVMELPNFSKMFMVECDGSESRLRAVLYQNGSPLRSLVSHSHPTIENCLLMRISS